MPEVALNYRPYEQLAGEPNVVVDGTPAAGTALTLSHWPGSPVVPVPLQADLSAQMAFRYLDHPDALHGGAALVSNNHFDQDGTVGVFALARPGDAVARRALLEDVAAAGDFATYRQRAAARASMVLSAFTDDERSPLGPLPADHGDRTAHLYTEGLGRLPELVDHPDRYRRLWEDEDAQLDESEAAIASGAVRIDDVPDVDLAVVTVPDGRRWGGHRFGGRRYEGIHPMAVHNATDRTALLLVTDGAYRFTYRYETWVQYRSRPLRRRVDLAPLAEALTAVDHARWHADPVDWLTPELQPSGPSALGPDVVTAAIVDHLRSAPPAFDPFAPRS